MFPAVNLEHPCRAHGQVLVRGCFEFRELSHVIVAPFANDNLIGSNEQEGLERFRSKVLRKIATFFGIENG